MNDAGKAMLLKILTKDLERKQRELEGLYCELEPLADRAERKRDEIEALTLTMENIKLTISELEGAC